MKFSYDRADPRLFGSGIKMVRLTEHFDGKESAQTPFRENG